MFEDIPLPPKQFRSEFVARSLSAGLWLCLINCFLALLYSAACCVIHPSILFSSEPVIFSTHFLSLLSQLDFFSAISLTLFSCCHSTKFCTFSSRYSKILAFLRRDSVAFICIYSILSWALVVTWGRHDYSLLLSPNTGQQNLVCLFYGLAFGLSAAFSFISSQSQVLSFPAIQQPKLFRIQIELASLSKRELISSLIRFWIASSFALLFLTALSPSWLLSHSTLSMVLVLLNPFFTLKIFLILTLSLIHNTLAWKLFNISHTHAYRFPCSANPFTSYLSLPEAVRSSSSLLARLAFQDLCSLALHSKQRRAVLFSLDAHTGQGDNWSQVYQACTRLLNEFIAKLDGECQEFPQIEAVASPFRSPSAQQMGAIASPTSSKSVSTHPDTRGSHTGVQDRIWEEFVRMLTAVKTFFQQSAVSRYFHDPLRLELYFRAYAEVGLYRWALVSLCELSSAAYYEDKYGLVQKNLSNTFTQLLTLSQQLEAHKPPTTLYSSRDAVDYRIRELNTLRAGMTASLASCLHRLALSYRCHLGSLGLSSEQQAKLVALARDHFSE